MPERSFPIISAPYPSTPNLFISIILTIPCTALKAHTPNKIINTPINFVFVG
ncbi:MAG: hypothetical protein AABX10_02960 [Nanoarchaeota archaeon]